MSRYYTLMQYHKAVQMSATKRWCVIRRELGLNEYAVRSIKRNYEQFLNKKAVASPQPTA